MGLRDIGASLPPGFKFYPSDEELVCHYLSKKITNEDALKGTLVEIDLHTCEPWQLPDVAKLNANEWYFFNFRDRKYATGYRTNRATTSGYWKATGKDRVVRDPRTKAIVGMRKTLVFHRNRAPNGTKTGWIMHEFRLDSPHMPPKEDWVLCRIFHKSKGDNNDKSQLSLQNNMTSAGATSLEFASFPPIDLAIPSYQPPVLSHFPLTRNPHHHHLNIHEVNPSFIHLSQDQMSNDGIGEIISRFDHDDYNLFNMNFGNGNMPRSLGELRFDNVDDHGNNLVFL